MELSNSDKTVVLLNLLDFQLNEIQRREQKEQQWFEWTSSLLLATFGVIVALASRSSGSLSYAVIIKSLATVLIAVPALLIILRIRDQSKGSITNAKAVERLQELLLLFEDGPYGVQSPYPHEWKNKLAHSRLKRKTPIYYILILLLMTACVITTVWLVL